MAQITETITLIDGMTPVLLRLARAASGVAGEFTKTRSAAESMSHAAASTDSRTVEKLERSAHGVTVEFTKAKSATEAMNRTVTSTDSEAVKKLNRSTHGAARAMEKLRKAFSSVIGQLTASNALANWISWITGKLIEIPGKIARASDAYAGMQARLRLVAGSAEGAAEMNNRIFASALRARGSYDGMLDSASKIAMTAKSAFPDPREVVPFVEGIQKLFTIGGTDVVGQKNAMLQLTQALGSGKLQGDEFRSIAEAAPLIEQMIAKEMGVAQGDLKQLGADGEITADIIKRAILNNTDEINRQFQQMPLTWEGIAQNMGTVGLRAFAPFLEAVNGIANSSGIQTVVGWIENALPVIGTGLAIITYAIGGVLDGIVGTADAIVSGIGGAVSILWPILAPIAGAVLSVAAAVGVYNAVVAVGSALTSIWSARTAIATAVTRLFNLTLLSNPITGVIMLIGAMIGIMASCAVATNGLRGAFMGAFQAIGNSVETVANFVIGCINWMINGFNRLAASWNSSPLRKAMGGDVVSNITTIDEVHGLGDKMGTWAGGIADSLGNMMHMPDASYGEGETFGGALDVNGMGDVADAVGKTADNTGRMANSIDMLDEELRYLRDVSTQESVSNYTSMPIQISLGGMHNTINNDMDLDGMYEGLRQMLEEGVQTAVEGMHV